MLIQQLEEKSRLGKILIKRQYISERELTEALVYQARHEVRIGEALMALDLITPLQLKRALRRQCWLRSITASVAIMVTPFAPAFAANSSLGTSSSATSQISLTILPKNQAQSNGELKFSSSHQTIESGFCTSELGADLFKIKLSGSGVNGDFRVLNSEKNQLDYHVSYKHHNQQFKPMQANQLSGVYSNTSLKKQCQDAYLNQLQVSFPKQDIPSNDSAPYNGLLTLTFSAE